MMNLYQIIKKMNQIVEKEKYFFEYTFIFDDHDKCLKINN